MKKIILLFLVGALMTACSQRLTPEKVHRLKRGMSRTEVHKKLGKPTESGTANMIAYTGATDLYQKDGLIVRTIFKDDRLEMLFLNETLVNLPAP